jgi:hypothetical protein
MTDVPDKSCAEGQITILCSITLFRKMWTLKTYGRAGEATDGNIIQRMRFLCWITKATGTHSEYVTFVALPRRQWLWVRT